MRLEPQTEVSEARRTSSAERWEVRGGEFDAWRNVEDVAEAGHGGVWVDETSHFARRAAERSLRPDVRDFILRWGREVDVFGAVSVTLVLADLPEDVRRDALVERALDWVIVMSRDGPALTCYRRANAWSFLRVKMRTPSRIKHRLWSRSKAEGWRA